MSYENEFENERYENEFGLKNTDVIYFVQQFGSQQTRAATTRGILCMLLQGAFKNRLDTLNAHLLRRKNEICSTQIVSTGLGACFCKSASKVPK